MLGWCPYWKVYVYTLMGRRSPLMARGGALRPTCMRKRCTPWSILQTRVHVHIEDACLKSKVAPAKKAAALPLKKGQKTMGSFFAKPK